jgi:hypothetical protein
MMHQTIRGNIVIPGTNTVLDAELQCTLQPDVSEYQTFKFDLRSKLMTFAMHCGNSAIVDLSKTIDTTAVVIDGKEEGQ